MLMLMLILMQMSNVYNLPLFFVIIQGLIHVYTVCIVLFDKYDNLMM